MDWTSRDEKLLCTFNDYAKSETDCQYTNALQEGNWISLIKGPVLEVLISGDVKSAVITHYLQKCDSEEKTYEVLTTGIAALLLFCELNWSGPGNNNTLDELDITWPAHVSAVTALELDCEEIDVNVKHPELFLIAHEILSAVKDFNTNLLSLWWMLRCKYIHQMLVEETSHTLFKQLEEICNDLLHLKSVICGTKFDVLLNLEIAYVFLLYGHVMKCEEHLNHAKEVTGLQFKLKGQLGLRTKYQSVPVSQLALEVFTDKEKSSILGESPCDAILPTELEMEDDLRLSKIKYIGLDEHVPTVLTSLEQAICLLNVRYLQRSQPKDELVSEELYPYINILLEQEMGPWSVRTCALLIKIKLGSNHKRSVETSLQQCECLVTNWSKIIQDHDAPKRLAFLWSSGLTPIWKWRHQLADLYISLGLIKTALEEYLQLKMWEDVIVCYTILQLRHKAAEIIKKQIDLKPSIKLYCLLGDATDDVGCYGKAWDMSNHRSSRAQRHWGHFLYSRRKFSECIPHYQASLDINSLQEDVWLRLGYAALTCENWDVAANAYRRYTFLEPGSFEAWNNLAKVYVKQNDKQRAYKALMESLKFNYDNWQLWENVVTVSIDTGHFDDVVRGYHRLLDLKGKHLDLEVLGLLVRGILQIISSGDGDSIQRLTKNVLELFGRLTSIYPSEPELWQLYADITTSDLQRGQRLLKVYRGMTQNSDWPMECQRCAKVVKYAILLGETSIKAWNNMEEAERYQANQLLSSARLTIQGIFRAAEAQKWVELESDLAILKNLLEELSNTLKASIGN